MRSEEEIKRERELMIEQLRKIGIKGFTITCDDCTSKYDCEWGYDGYNTDGDCLAEK